MYIEAISSCFEKMIVYFKKLSSPSQMAWYPKITIFSNLLIFYLKAYIIQEYFDIMAI